MPMHNLQAEIVLFDLQGNSGFGLLGGNENPEVFGGGSGGEIGGGISFDDISKMLTINLGWGSVNGFTDLTGIATAMHIHQSSGFGTNGGVVVGLNTLAGFNSSATAGGFSGMVSLTDDQETSLLSGLLYINVHTSLNPGGEIRGNLTPVTAVPEPSSMALLALASVPIAIARKRARRKSLAS